MSMLRNLFLVLILMTGFLAPLHGQQPSANHGTSTESTARPAGPEYSKAVRALLDEIESSLGQDLKTATDIPALKMEEIERHFLEAPRTTAMSEFRELKYALIHWRRQTVRKLVAFIQSASDRDSVLALEAINLLAVELDPFHLSKLQDRIDRMMGATDVESARKALLHQKPVTSEKRPYLIVPTRHAEKTETSKTRVDHSNLSQWVPQYLADEPSTIEPAPESGEGAYKFRNRLILKPGDMVLIEQNVDFCRDLNTSISVPTSQFSHSAIFLEVDHDGKKVPAILEIYSHGLRIVPADLYLGRRFSGYTEIHRFKERAPEWTKKLSALAARYDKEKEEWCYDFYAKEFDPKDAKREKTANCSNLPSHVLIELGCNPIESRCEVAEGARKTLTALGLGFEKYLTPTDYKRDPRLDIVGVVDSMNLESLLAHELVTRNSELEHTFGGMLAHRQWDESKMPPLYGVKVNTLEQIYGKNAAALWGVNLTTEWPWKPSNFPKAPPKVIAFIQSGEHVVEKAMHDIRKDIVSYPFHRDFRPTLQPVREKSEGGAVIARAIERGHDGHKWLSISALENDPAVQADIRAKLKPLEEFLKQN